MAERKIIKHYDNGEMTIKWEPSICTHSGICARSLPSVFKPKERPWIQMENSDTETIKNVVEKCPSGAISYAMDSESQESNNDTPSNQSLVIEVLANGPLIAKGEFNLVDSDGTKQTMKNNTALCRCGASQNKPFCDGAHKDIDFKG